MTQPLMRSACPIITRQPPYLPEEPQFVSVPVWGMIETQLHTGMRQGEVMTMRGCDLNVSGAVWEYSPDSHKTEHHGRRRMVFIGPKAQAVLREFLKTEIAAYLFRPVDARKERKGKRRFRERYTSDSYNSAIRRGIQKANRERSEAGEMEIPHWHPNQLRHTAGTLVRREFGLDAARTVLGHSSAAVTEIYAEMDMAKAAEIAAKIG